MKVETRESPWAFARDNGMDLNGFIATPRTRVTFDYSPRVAMTIGWHVFWRALWYGIRRRRVIRFWLEDER